MTLPCLFRLELVQLSSLPFDLSLLRRHFVLYVVLLVLPSWHLFADPSPAYQTNDSADRSSAMPVCGNN